MMVIALCMVACGNDDDDKTADLAAAVAGQYEGTLSLSVNGNGTGSSEGTVTVTKKAEGKVDVLLFDFVGIGHNNMTGVTANNVTVTEQNGIYTLTATAVKSTASMGGNTLEVKGTLTGKIQEGKLTFTFNFTPGSMPMPVTANFSGTKK